MIVTRPRAQSAAIPPPLPGITRILAMTIWAGGQSQYKCICDRTGGKGGTEPLHIEDVEGPRNAIHSHLRRLAYHDFVATNIQIS